MNYVVLGPTFYYKTSLSKSRNHLDLGRHTGLKRNEVSAYPESFHIAILASLEGR